MTSVCPKCVHIGKSGKMSCCGRGGSWFGTCGSGGRSTLEHTWYEGTRVCKAWDQLKTITGYQLYGGQQSSTGSSNGTDTPNSKAVITAVKTLIFTSAKTARHTSGSSLSTCQECAKPLNIVVYTTFVHLFISCQFVW